MNRRRRWTIFGIALPATLAVAGCAAVPTPQTPPPPAPTPPPPPAAAPAPPPALSWEERALNPGGWRYDAGSRTATFVATASPGPLLTMACNAGTIRLTAPLSGNVSLRTTGGADMILFEGGSANVPGRDPRLDRIAFSRGRFALEAPGGSALTLPVQSEIGRVIEDCR